MQCSQGPVTSLRCHITALSHHRAVTCTSSSNRGDIKQEKVSERKLRDIDAVDFLKDMDRPRIMKVEENIDSICAMLNEGETKALNMLH